MALIRWEPMRELDSLQTEMNRLFASFLEPGQPSSPARRWAPPMDLVEHEEHYLLKADLPGLRQEDIAIEFEGDMLSISGERHDQYDRKDGNFVRVERTTGGFRRILSLPEGVDPDAVQATYVDGVLEITIPKPEQRKPRRVKLTVGGKPTLVEA
jgi:HSP20 family protein